MPFSGKRVLITGGAKGLGRATVKKFHDAGAIVHALDNDSEHLTSLKSELPSVRTIDVDLFDWEATKAAVEQAGPFDHLVNNAGVIRESPFMEISSNDFDFIFGVHFKAVLNVSQAFAKGVVAAGIKGASIVNVSSTSDRRPIPGFLVVCCSKAALTMMTKCMARELGPHGIRVNCIRPDAMRTTLFDPIIPQGETFDTWMEPFLASSPIPRVLETTEAAELILFLCGSNAAMITGEDVAIDGGSTIV